MMHKTHNLQDLCLLRDHKRKLPVTIFLANGYELRRQIVGYDSFVVVLMTDSRQQVIYKHAISTIVPERPLPLIPEEAG